MQLNSNKNLFIIGKFSSLQNCIPHCHVIGPMIINHMYLFTTAESDTSSGLNALSLVNGELWARHLSPLSSPPPHLIWRRGERPSIISDTVNLQRRGITLSSSARTKRKISLEKAMLHYRSTAPRCTRPTVQTAFAH